MAQCLNFNGIDIEAINFNGEINIDTININGFEIKCSEEFICSFTENFTNSLGYNSATPLLMPDGNLYLGGYCLKDGILTKDNLDCPSPYYQFSNENDIFYIKGKSTDNTIYKYNILSKELSSSPVLGTSLLPYIIENIGNNKAVGFQKTSATIDRIVLFDLTNMNSIVYLDVPNNNLEFYYAGKINDITVFYNNLGRYIFIDSVNDTIRIKSNTATATSFHNIYENKFIFAFSPATNQQRFISVSIEDNSDNTTPLVFTLLFSGNFSVPSFMKADNYSRSPIATNGNMYYRSSAGLNVFNLISKGTPTQVTNASTAIGTYLYYNRNLILIDDNTLFLNGFLFDIPSKTGTQVFTVANTFTDWGYAGINKGKIYCGSRNTVSSTDFGIFMYDIAKKITRPFKLFYTANSLSNYVYKNKHLISGAGENAQFNADYTEVFSRLYTNLTLVYIIVTNVSTGAETVYELVGETATPLTLQTMNNKIYFIIGNKLYSFDMVEKVFVLEFSNAQLSVAGYYSKVGNKYLAIGEIVTNSRAIRVIDPIAKTISLNYYPSTLMAQVGFALDKSNYFITLDTSATTVSTRSLIAIMIRPDNTLSFTNLGNILGNYTNFPTMRYSLPKTSKGWFVSTEKHLWRIYETDGGTYPVAMEQFFNYWTTGISAIANFVYLYSKGKIVLQDGRNFCTQDLSVKEEIALSSNQTINIDMEVDVEKSEYVYSFARIRK